jgi:outer membrane protein assembly factor BamB
MNGVRTAAALLLLLGVLGCGSPEARPESYGNGSAPSTGGDANQESVLVEVGNLPFKKRRWDHRFSEWTIQRFSLGREYLYIETPDHKVVAIDRFEGLTKWVFDIPSRTGLDHTPSEASEVYDQVRTYEEALRAQVRVIEDLLKTEGPGLKSQEAQREKNRLTQLLNAAQRGDNVYLVARQILYCIARTTGKWLWSKDLPFAPSSKAYATRESIYIAAADNSQVWRLDVERRGESLQRFPANVGSGDRTILNTPLVDGAQLFFVSADGNCYCYDVNKGDQKWTFKALDKLAADPTLHKVRETVRDSAGRESVRTRRYLLCGGLDYALYCIDPNDGQLIWKYETGGFLRSPILVKGASVYVKSDDGALFSLELDPQHRNSKTGATEGVYRTGKRRWKLPLGERFVVRGGDDRVLALGPASELYLMNDRTGEIAGRYPMVDIRHVLSNPWDSILYVATEWGHVFALEESGSQY